MIRLAAAAAVLLGASQDSAPPPPPVEFAQVTIRQQVIVRVPRSGQRRADATASAPRQWRGGAGPRCIPVRQIAGAMPSAASVDFLLRDNKRIRARLGQRCAGLDYYDGMYLTANPDGQICANRDVVRSRMGGKCGISEFRTLQPARP